MRLGYVEREKEEEGDLNIYMYIHTSTHVRPSVLDHLVQLIVYSETGEPSKRSRESILCN